MIKVEHENKIIIAKLDRAITNALDLELINKLSSIIEQIKKDPDIRGLILTSANDKFFSIGFDIPALYDLARKDFRVFYQTFNRLCIDLFSLPVPTMAAITGHAVAGGCIIALCCDYRYIASGKTKMGLNEVKLGVPIPYPVDRMLYHIVGHQTAREISDTGDFYEPDTLLAMGLVDKVISSKELMDAAITKVAALGDNPRDAFAMIKNNRVEPILAQIGSKLKEKEDAFLRAWYNEKTRQRLKKAMEKF